MTESTSKNVRTRHTEFLNRTQFYIKLCFYDKKSKKKIFNCSPRIYAVSGFRYGRYCSNVLVVTRNRLVSATLL